MPASKRLPSIVLLLIGGGAKICLLGVALGQDPSAMDPAGATRNAIPHAEPAPWVSGGTLTSDTLSTSPSVQELRGALLEGGASCRAAAHELGLRGWPATLAVPTLAAVATDGCGVGGDEPLAALAAIAADLRREAPSLSSEEIEAAVRAFQEGEQALGAPLPAGIQQSLGTLRSTLRARRLGWLSPLVEFLGAAVREGASAARAVGGLLAALALVGVVLLLFRRAGKILPSMGWPGARSRKGTPGSDLEVWLAHTISGPSQEGAPPGGGDDSPGSRVDVLVGSLRTRHQGGAEAPPWDRVERTLQILAWQTMREGTFARWVPLDDLAAAGPREALDPVLAYAAKAMEVVSHEPRRSRVRLSTPAPLTAHLGAQYLLEEGRGSPEHLLASLGVLHAAVRESRSGSDTPVFLGTVASALLAAAAGPDGSNGNLGVVEDALRELARETPSLLQASVPENVESAQVRLGRLLARLRAENHPAVREKLVRAIGELGPPALPALPALQEALEHDTVGVALAAVEAMGRLGPDAGAVAPLLTEYLGKSHPGLRLAATRALGRLGPSGAAAAPVLMEWVSQGGVPHELRARAAEALGNMPGEAERAIPSLAELLRSPVAVEVRAAAALALARLDPGRREVEDVLTWARRSPDPALRGMAGVALLVRERRLHPRGAAPPRREAARWALPLAACAGSLAVAEAAAVALTQALSPGALFPALLVTPALAFPAGVAYGVATRRIPLHPSLGGGATAWVGASLGLMGGFVLSSGLSPLALALGGGLALGSGAAGGTLVRSALHRS